MFGMTPEFGRAVHEARRRQLLDEAEVRRVHREIKAARRAERPARRSGGWFRALTGRGVTHRDAKVARLAQSWLELDHRTARLLARFADEVAVPAGTVLVPGRFSYIGLDEARRGLVVTPGMPAVTLETAATVLILTSADLEQIEHDVPRLAFRSAPEMTTHTDDRLAAEPTPIEPQDRVEPSSITVTHRRDGRGVRFPARPPTVAALRDDRAIAAYEFAAGPDIELRRSESWTWRRRRIRARSGPTTEEQP